MKRLVHTMIMVAVSTMLAILLVCMYFGAVLQESYRLNPPTVAEIGE